MSLPGRLVPIGQGGGIRLFCHDSGPDRGPVVVLIHGYLVSGWTWRTVAPVLAEQGYRVIVVDLPGAGESDRPPVGRRSITGTPAAGAAIAFDYGIESFAWAVEELLRALGVVSAALGAPSRSVSLVGHSMGGAIAVALARRRRVEVNRLALVSASCGPLHLPLSAVLALTPLVGELLFKRLYRKRDLGRYFQSAVDASGASVVDDYVDYYWERLNRPGGLDAAYQTLRTLNDLEDFSPELAALRLPTLLIWGEGDPITPLGIGQRLAAAVDGARLEILAPCGHAPHEERPSELLAKLLPFLAGNVPGRLRIAGGRREEPSERR
jgi:pimeloyl-ACP methyl ester carboxylesterase